MCGVCVIMYYMTIIIVPHDVCDLYIHVLLPAAKTLHVIIAWFLDKQHDLLFPDRVKAIEDLVTTQHLRFTGDKETTCFNSRSY